MNVESAQLTWHAVDTSNYNVNLFHFARSLDKNTSNVLLGSDGDPCPARDPRRPAGHRVQRSFLSGGVERSKR